LALKIAPALLAAALALPALARAQADEIQVYDATIAAPGEVELTFHANTTPDGQTEAAFAGGVVPDHSTNGTLEIAIGASESWELGFYLPVYTITGRGTLLFDGAKLRSLWVVPHARQRDFFYGVNVEFSINARHWASTRTSLEIRPIVGWHLGTGRRWDLIFNPIVDSDFKGIGLLHFAPAERLAYNASPHWAFALEHYGDLGPARHLDALARESHSVFAVADYTLDERNSFEFGVGHGLTPATDRTVVKLIVNHTL